METQDEKPSMLPPMPVSAPELKTASRFSVTMSAQDLLISFGYQRPIFHQNGEQAGLIVDYYASFSMSPVTAKQFRAALDLMVNKYEEQFGVIPVDPAAAQKLQGWVDENSGKAKTKTPGKRASRSKR